MSFKNSVDAIKVVSEKKLPKVNYEKNLEEEKFKNSMFYDGS